MIQKNTVERLAKKQVRIRKKIKGTSGRPRLVVFRSAKHAYAQIIDDSTGKTLLSVSTLSKDLREEVKQAKTPIARFKLIGAAAAKKALILRNPGAWTGWSFMVRARAYARCQMGDSAFKKLDSSLVWNYSPGNMLNHNTHNQSVWQLDGNIGYSATVTEMLAQSHIGNKIQLLLSCKKRMAFLRLGREVRQG